MGTLAFSGDHLTDDEKITQMDKLVKLLSSETEKFTGWERDFWEGLVVRIGAAEAYVPSYRELICLRKMMEKHGY